MIIYRVTCAKDSEGSLVGVNLFDPDNVTDFIGYDAEGNEIYEIKTEHDIDRVLDLSNGVIEYLTA